MLKIFKWSLSLLAALSAPFVVAMSTGSAHADTWPNRPVTVVVPFGPGAITDQAARLLSQLLQEKFDQPFVVENRPGGGSLIGVRQVAAAEPDGYTLMVTAWSIATLMLGTENEFNPVEELTPVTRIVRNPVAMLVPTSLGVNDISEFISHVKANPDEAFYGLTAPGGAAHVYHEQFNLLTGTEMKPIVYQSGAQMITDASQARLVAWFGTVSSAQSMVDAGHLEVLAYLGEGASDNVPPAPVLRDEGVDLEWASWTGLFGPPGMDPELLDTIYEAVAEVIAGEEFVGLLDRSGARPDVITPEQFVEQLAREREDVIEGMESTGVTPPEV